MTRERRIRQLTTWLEAWTREHESRAAEVTLPGYLYFLAERLTDHEIERARLTNQTPAWALEPRT